MRQFLVTAVVMAIAASPPTVHAQSDGFFFRPKDRVAFLGDSITEQYQYSSTIELYLTTRFPTWNMSFWNAGIGGDTAGGGSGRFQKHVLDEKPTAVTINFGMNDGGYGAFNPGSAANYAKNTEQMLTMAKKAGVRVALISPNAVDVRKNEKLKVYIETQKQFYAPLKEIAAKFDAPFVDQYAITRAALEKMQADDAQKDPARPPVNPFPDSVHTSSSGGLLMAHAILTGLKAPALVSDVTIDVPAKSAKADKAKVEKLTVGETGISFERTDEALPLPIAKDWATLLPYVNNLKDLNWYGLKVAGLPAKEYSLSIDGKEIGKYSAKELADGVNLGNVSTGPVYDKSKAVWDAINAKNEFNKKRFRGVILSTVPEWLADVAKERKPLELERLAKVLSERQAAIYEMMKPTTYKFELKAQ